MGILTVNGGSTSLKIERYDLAPGPLPAIADPPAPTLALDPSPADAEHALAEALREPVDAIAHRFVRLPDGAPPVLRLDAESMARIVAVGADDPLHDASALTYVQAALRAAPEAPQFAVSDSAFHRTMPAAATTYAIPRELTRSGLRRLGYHGLSHEYAAHRGCKIAGLDVTRARVVTAHLGGGSSLCAVRNGESIDTTMGYTPLEGLPMATRSGSVDPGLLLHLLRGGMSVADLEQMLERRSGLLGMSGVSGDLRELRATRDNPDAQTAFDVLVWRLRASLGAMTAVLGGVDLIAFTGGIGEHSAETRAGALKGGLGVSASLDIERNAAMSGTEGRIDATPSQVPVVVVTAREGWQLARAVNSLVTRARF